MMLRSSSTPIPGSLLSSGASDSGGGNHHHHQFPESLTPNQTPSSHNIKKLTSVNNAHLGFRSFTTKFLCNSSSPNVHDQFSYPRIGLIRAQSEGNLVEGLLQPDEFSLSASASLHKKFERKPFLEPIPSFSLMGLRNYLEGEENEDYEEGLEDTEEHYRKMLEENPSNPLFLRNYAQFLYQTKKDAKGAEEYYSRAILADPGDGEVLSQYAKLVWEVHRDAEIATSYFERAVQAAGGDSHVQAAYASFLWEVEDDDESNEVYIPAIIHERAMASAAAY